MKYLENIPAWLLKWIILALLGEIDKSTRAIAIAFNEKNELILRCYFDREVTEDDYENLEVIITNILANTSSTSDITKVSEEIIYTSSPLNELDSLDGFIYMRKEWLN